MSIPALPVKKSVSTDAIICLECGKHQKMLKRHIGTAHGLSVDEYRSRWSLAADYPMVAPNYAAHRSQLAVKIGLGRKKPADDAHEGSVEPTGKRPYNCPASRWSKPTE